MDYQITKEAPNYLNKRIFRLLSVELAPEICIDPNLELENQRVIKIDADRTLTGILNLEEKVKLEHLLTHYCKEEAISYKQGMNEIMAPFVLMCRKGLDLKQAYFSFKMFVSLCLPTMFEDTVTFN